MITRIILAAVAGGFLIFFQQLGPIYEGPISALAAVTAIPFGIVLSGLAAGILSLLFLPVVLTKAWKTWRELWWLPCVLFVLGIVSTIVSTLPFMIREGLDPEFGEITVYESHPWFAIAGWLLVLLSIVTFPKLGFSDSKRWV